MKILIIDDDELSIFLTENLLLIEDETLEIKTFLAGSEALKALTPPNADIPNLIFLDLNMSVMSGWGFLDALAPLEEKLSGKCDIYILSSSVDKSDTAKAKQYSIVKGFIHKPISSDDITHVLSKYRSK